jgi:hypothetical protein
MRAPVCVDTDVSVKAPSQHDEGVDRLTGRLGAAPRSKTGRVCVSREWRTGTLATLPYLHTALPDYLFLAPRLVLSRRARLVCVDAGMSVAVTFATRFTGREGGWVGVTLYSS